MFAVSELPETVYDFEVDTVPTTTLPKSESDVAETVICDVGVVPVPLTLTFLVVAPELV